MSRYITLNSANQARVGKRLLLLGGLALLLALCASLFTVQPARAITPLTGGGGDSAALTISAPSSLSGPAGTNVTVSGSHWFTGATVTLAVGDSNGDCNSTTSLNNATGTADNTGAVQITFAWPALPAGQYPVCGTATGTPKTVVSTNTFNELSQAAPTLTLPTKATSGSTVTIAGANWLPGGTQVEVLAGPQDGNGCATSLATLTSQTDGTLSGTFKAPAVTTQTSFLVVAVNPAGTCSGTVNPTLKATATLVITPSGSTNGGGGTSTAKTPTATPNSPNGNPGPCAPNSNCNTIGGWPWWAVCLILLGLLLLLLALIILLARRRNQEVVVTEEDITSQVDPNSVAPMGTMRFVRTVRVTTQIVDRATGAVRDTKISVFDEFADASGATRRRPRK